MHRTIVRRAWALAAVIACLPAPARAQELRRDSVWNGVVTGAAVGAGLGVVVAKGPGDICSVKDCALLFAVAGGALGGVVDGAIGRRAPVVPGQWIDDSKWNGALIGAGINSALDLTYLARHCGTGHGRVQCTPSASFDSVWKSALFGAAVGAVVDAAIPTRAPNGSGSRATSRRLVLTFSTRF